MEIKFVLGVICLMGSLWLMIFGLDVMSGELKIKAASRATRVSGLVSLVLLLVTIGMGLILGKI